MLRDRNSVPVTTGTFYFLYSFVKSHKMVRQVKARSWCFTFNNYTEDDVNRLGRGSEVIEYLIAGKEVGEQGTPHLQGFIRYKNRIGFNTVKGFIGGNAHIESAFSNDKAIEYCKKDNDFFEFGSIAAPGVRTDLDAFKHDVSEGLLCFKEIREKHSTVYAKYPRFCIEFVSDNSPCKEIEAHPLREWQQTLNQYLNLAPDDRTIVFVVDKTGNSGKSWFAHYYTSIHKGCQVMLPAKKLDMAYALEPALRVLFVDAPRSKQGDFIMYDFLEDVKNGYVFSGKYESRFKKLEKVHVVVNMNEHPDMSKLSHDRYKIIEI